MMVPWFSLALSGRAVQAWLRAPRSPGMLCHRSGGLGGQEASIHLLSVFRASFQKPSTRSDACFLLGDAHDFHADVPLS